MILLVIAALIAAGCVALILALYWPAIERGQRDEG